MGEDCCSFSKGQEGLSTRVMNLSTCFFFVKHVLSLSVQFQCALVSLLCNLAHYGAWHPHLVGSRGGSGNYATQECFTVQNWPSSDQFRAIEQNGAAVGSFGESKDGPLYEERALDEVAT